MSRLSKSLMAQRAADRIRVEEATLCKGFVGRSARDIADEVKMELTTVVRFLSSLRAEGKIDVVDQGHRDLRRPRLWGSPGIAKHHRETREREKARARAAAAERRRVRDERRLAAEQVRKAREAAADAASEDLPEPEVVRIWVPVGQKAPMVRTAAPRWVFDLGRQAAR